MHTLTQLRAMLDERGLRPKKSLGQNFLIDKNLAARLLDASGVGHGSLVLEIGPGAGALTEDLLDRGCLVVACELDDALADLLTERFTQAQSAGRFSLARGDCLASKRSLSRGALEALGGRPFTLAANLPYQAATPVMATLATTHHPSQAARAGVAPCIGQFVTIQREVADRLLARPGTKDYGALTVIVQAMTAVERLATLPPECFWPRPDVTSAMVALRPLERPATTDPEGLARCCAALFQRRRKMVGSTLGSIPPGGWPLGVLPTQRPEALTVEQFAALASIAPSWGSLSGGARSGGAP